MSSVREEIKLEPKNRFSVLSTQNEDTDIEESWKAIKMHIQIKRENIGFQKKPIKGMDIWGDMEINRKKIIGKIKCKQEQNETTEDQ